MMYELSKQGLAMAVIDALEAIYKEHKTAPYRFYVDPIAVYNNLDEVCNAIEKYQKRIRRKNADKHKAYVFLLEDVFEYKVFKHTEYGQKEFDEFLEKIKNIKK